MIERWYKGWRIVYEFMDGVNPKWHIIGEGIEYWLNGAMLYDSVKKFIDKLGGG